MSDSDALRVHKMRPPLPWVSIAAATVVIGFAVAGLPLGAVAALSAVISIAFVTAVGVASGRLRLLLAVGAIAYVAAFQWVYIAWIVPVYGYSGLIDAGADLPSLAVMTVLAVMPVVWLPIEVGRPSEIVLWFLYLLGYIPAVVVPIRLLGPDLWAVLPFGALLAVGFAALLLMQRIPRAAQPWSGLTERSFDLLIVILGLGALVYLVVFFGIPTYVPDFVTAYDARTEFGAAQSNVPAAGYIVTWSGNVIYPLLIALGLARSRRLLIVLGSVGELLIYSQAGFKAVLFAILLVPLLFAAIRIWRRQFGTVLMWAAVGVLGVSVATTAVTGSLWPLALYAVRLLALPGQLTAYYLDFFTSHATYELSRSFLRWFMEAPYDIDPPYLIGIVYLHATVDANANLWADAMANFGLAGIVPFSIILGAVLWVLDYVAADRDLLVIGPVVAIAGLSLSNGALFTSILTFGLGFAIFMIALMPRRASSPGNEPGSARAS